MIEQQAFQQVSVDARENSRNMTDVCMLENFTVLLEKKF